MSTSALPQPYEAEPVCLEPLRKDSRKKLWFWVRLAVSGSVLAWLMAGMDWKAVESAMVGIKWPFLAAAVAVYCSSQMVSSVRWQLLARPLGFAEPLSRYIALYFVGMFFNLFLPTSVGGDVVRAWGLAGRSGRRVKAFLAVVAERFSGLLALLLLASVATIVGIGSYPLWILALVWGLAATAAIGTAFLPFLARWNHRLHRVAEALSIQRGHGRRFAAAFALSLVVQTAGILQIYLIGLAMQLPVSFLIFAIVIPIVTLLSMLPISMGGLGVREGSLILLLAPAGIGSASALSLGLLWFCTLAVAGLIGGAVYLWGSMGYEGVSRDGAPLSTHHSPREGAFYGSLSDHSDQGRTGQPAALV